MELKLKDIPFSIWWDELKRVATYLEGRDIPYYLDCGTLLGIIRDNGPIPHDTDIKRGIKK